MNARAHYEAMAAEAAAQTQRVDVLAAYRPFIGNFPRSTSSIRSWCAPIGKKRPSTGVVLNALISAEQAGIVQCVGTGEQHNRAFNANAARLRERYWVLTEAGLAAVEAVIAGGASHG